MILLMISEHTIGKLSQFASPVSVLSAKNLWNHKAPFVALKERFALLDSRYLLRVVNRGSQLFTVTF